VSIRFSQTVYAGKSTLSSGPAQIEGNTRSDLKLMLRLRF
jgi:hypothetical protein